MGLDIRLPIGLMFVLLGLLLTGYGLLRDPAIYQRSLGVNINLWWGLAMLIFGLVMLVLGRRGQRPESSRASRAESHPSRKAGSHLD
jgi:multisubunit Na+/H+ antiporter MnhG subunit